LSAKPLHINMLQRAACARFALSCTGTRVQNTRCSLLQVIPGQCLKRDVHRSPAGGMHTTRHAQHAQSPCAHLQSGHSPTLLLRTHKASHTKCYLNHRHRRCPTRFQAVLAVLTVPLHPVPHRLAVHPEFLADELRRQFLFQVQLHGFEPQLRRDGALLSLQPRRASLLLNLFLDLVRQVTLLATFDLNYGFRSVTLFPGKSTLKIWSLAHERPATTWVSLECPFRACQGIGFGYFVHSYLACAKIALHW
jgi:hypothetical protein